jgi:hypothetical protein
MIFLNPGENLNFMFKLYQPTSFIIPMLFPTMYRKTTMLPIFFNTPVMHGGLQAICSHMVENKTNNVTIAHFLQFI